MTAFEILKILGLISVSIIIAIDATRSILGEKSVWEEIFSERSENGEENDRI